MAILSRYRPLLLAGAIASSIYTTASALAPPQQQHAVVVGAGPVGIAAALTLATHHNFTVTLLESSPALSAQTKYDPTKAFLYNVNGRGQTLTKQFLNMQAKLEERSIPSGGVGGTIGTMLTIVPADPNEEIPEKKANNEALKKGEDDLKSSDSNSSEKMKDSMQSEKATGVGYWLPRHEMVKLMAECIDDHNAKSDTCKIDFLLGQECTSIIPTKQVGSNYVCVTARNTKDGSLILHQATLVVGADGMNSKVRQCLASAPSNIWQAEGGFKPGRFIPKKWTSPASHLRIKVLQLPAQFEIPNANGKPPLKTKSEDILALRSVFTGPKNYLSLGLLPMKDNNAVRPANIITRPDHEVWDIKDGPAMQKYFQKAFPRFNFGTEGGMISSEEFERFANAEGTRFPYCQYSEGLTVWDESGTCGVALVGDAIHAFPPDIGQGVNAGLMDVVCLDRALKGMDTTATGKKEVDTVSKDSGEKKLAVSQLKSNLQRYQKQHAPEIAALIRLARFGAPYQYRQPHRADRILQKVWMANVVLRLMLNKLTFGLVPTQCIMLTQNNELTYRQVMRRADTTTAVLRALVLGVIGLIVKRRFFGVV